MTGRRRGRQARAREEGWEDCTELRHFINAVAGLLLLLLLLLLFFVVFFVFCCCFSTLIKCYELSEESW